MAFIFLAERNTLHAHNREAHGRQLVQDQQRVRVPQTKNEFANIKSKKLAVRTRANYKHDFLNVNSNRSSIRFAWCRSITTRVRLFHGGRESTRRVFFFFLNDIPSGYARNWSYARSRSHCDSVGRETKRKKKKKRREKDKKNERRGRGERKRGAKWKEGSQNVRTCIQDSRMKVLSFMHFSWPPVVLLTLKMDCEYDGFEVISHFPSRRHRDRVKGNVWKSSETQAADYFDPEGLVCQTMALYRVPLCFGKFTGKLTDQTNDLVPFRRAREQDEIVLISKSRHSRCKMVTAISRMRWVLDYCSWRWLLIETIEEQRIEELRRINDFRRYTLWNNIRMLEIFDVKVLEDFHRDRFCCKR